MEKEKKETEEIITADIEQGSEANFASHKAAQNHESSFWQQDMRANEREMDEERLLKNEKQSQSIRQAQDRFAGFQPETLNSKHEILNNIEYPENQILETNVKC